MIQRCPKNVDKKHWNLKWLTFPEVQVKKQLELEREMNEKLNTKLVESNEEKRKCEENFLEMKNKQLTVLEELQVAKKKCEDSEKNLESKEEILKDTANGHAFNSASIALPCINAFQIY